MYKNGAIRFESIFTTSTPEMTYPPPKKTKKK